MNRLLDKFCKLDLVKRGLETIGFDISTNLEKQKNVVQQDMALFLDKSKHQAVLDSIQTLEQAKQKLDHDLKTLREYVSTNLRRREVKLIQRDYDAYESHYFTQEEHLKVNEFLSESFRTFLKAKIQHYSDWRYPTLDMNPVNGEFTRLMVSGDPLYVMVQDSVQADIIRTRFNDFYGKRRLRVYDDLQHIPDQQLGLTFCVNHFEYLPLDPIKDIAKSLYDKTRPGGRLFFTYNDCEQRASLELMDRNFRCYNTMELIRGMLYSIGWDYVDHGAVDGVWNWMDVKKSGELSSIKQSAPACAIVQKKQSPEDLPDQVRDWVLKHRADAGTWWRTLQTINNTCPGGPEVWNKHMNTIKLLIQRNNI